MLYGGWKNIWQHFYPSKEKEQYPYGGPILYPNAMVPFSQAEIKEGKTTAPKHFTEDTLLSSMETAGVEDIPEDAERKGLGTPPTSAWFDGSAPGSGLVLPLPLCYNGAKFSRFRSGGAPG